MKKILVLGATSAIAQEVKKIFASEGAAFFLVARHQEKLEAMAGDLKVRGAAQVLTQTADLNDFSRHESLVQQATQGLAGLDLVLIAHGTLGDQEACEASYAVTEQELRTNFLNTVSLLTLLANQFEQQGSGCPNRACLAIITSVAGDRGRRSNYVYGAAKGGLAIFLQGLRHRLASSGVRVLTIKPGLVDTPMTAHLKKNFLFASPEQVAQGIHRAIVRGKDVVYLPGFWRWIMGVVKLIPESIFKKLSF